MLTCLLRLPPAASPLSASAAECAAALARALPAVVPPECAPLLLLRLGPKEVVPEDDALAGGRQPVPPAVRSKAAATRDSHEQG